MRTAFIICLFLLTSNYLHAQTVAPQNPKKVAPNDTIVPGKGTRETQIRKIDEAKVRYLSDSNGNEPRKSKLVDTTMQNKYGNLLEDDPEYNKRYPLWIPAAEVVGTLAFTWAADRYLLNAQYARTGFQSWNTNLTQGWNGIQTVSA